jgi:hypothetical protein
MIDLRREICKPVLKLDFSAHCIMESSQNRDSDKMYCIFSTIGMFR